MSDTGRPGSDPTQPGGLPAWGQTGATPPAGPPRNAPPPVTSWQAGQSQPPATSSAPTAATPAAVPPAPGAARRWRAAGRRPMAPRVVGPGDHRRGGRDRRRRHHRDRLVPQGLRRGRAGRRGVDHPAALADAHRGPGRPHRDHGVRDGAPDSVLQYALATSADNPTWVAAGAIEAYTETYTDGGTGTMTVNAGQWETPPRRPRSPRPSSRPSPAPAPNPTATSAAGARETAESGNVTAAGATVGTYTIADAGNGTGVAVWTNGTTVFQATAPSPTSSTSTRPSRSDQDAGVRGREATRAGVPRLSCLTSVPSGRRPSCRPRSGP